MEDAIHKEGSNAMKSSEGFFYVYGGTEFDTAN